MDLVSQSDPLCIIKMTSSKKEYSTSVIDNNANPFWDEKFQLPIVDPETDVVQIELYDNDAISEKDLIGILNLPISNYLEGEVISDWFTIVPVRKMSSPPRIKLTFQVAVTGRPPYVPY
ncbi:C2 domain containing protein [Histomonas meleagridis]|uniref:C2 domain containing protein n=1 Tax=Histomonas meleagridis TaxID=135588 RepID=UPI003559B39F|nr:C2 domain containing protein [Histomonas meleagridis]KAH0806070.1 C2 domain containing protein [Histomonas meleagridis]